MTPLSNQPEKQGGGTPPLFPTRKKGGVGVPPPRITNRRITNRQPRRGERVPPSPLCGWHFSGSFYSIVSHFFRSIVFSSTCNWKPFLPTIGGLDPRVPPGSVLLSSTVKLAHVRSGRRSPEREDTRRGHRECPHLLVWFDHLQRATTAAMWSQYNFPSTQYLNV